jgi:LysM repeat protein
MGLFSFLKNAGAKTFKEAEKSAAKEVKPGEAKVNPDTLKKYKLLLLKSVAESLHLPVRDLHLDLNDDRVTVSGEVDSQADREKIVLALGNVEGIATVEDNIVVAAEPEPEADFYEVKKGDSLSKIAKQFYGDAMKYPAIFEANKPMLKDPNLIYPGQMLRIPKL